MKPQHHGNPAATRSPRVSRVMGTNLHDVVRYCRQASGEITRACFLSIYISAGAGGGTKAYWGFKWLVSKGFRCEE